MSYNPNCNYSNFEDEGENENNLLYNQNTLGNTYITPPQQLPPQQLPPHAIITLPVEQNNDVSELMKIYSYHRTLIFFTVIDGFFLMLFAFISSPPMSLFLLVALLLVVFGYKGVTEYKYLYIIFYLIYLFLSFLFEIVMLSRNSHRDTSIIIFSVFRILMQSYIIYFTIKFYNLIRNSNIETLNLLRSGWNPEHNTTF